MSETGNVQRLTLPGLLSVLLILGGGPGLGDARAASLYQSASSLALSKTIFAQTAEEENEPSASEETAEDGESVQEDVPFSELNDALKAARSRLTELTKAAEIAKVAGELRDKLQTTEAENRELKSVLSKLQTEHSALQSAKQAAGSRIEGLEKTSDEAAAEAKRLDEELVSMRWQNSQLSTSLARAETTARESAGELDKVRTELGSHVDGLTSAADESATEIARLQRALDAAQEETLVAERQQAEGAAELAELKKSSEDSASDSARLAKDLDGTITELAKTRDELTTTQNALQEAQVTLRSTEQETGVLREQLTGNRSETDQLRAKLEAAETDLAKFRTLNAGLEQQVELLKTAAGEATDAARQNLLAVEDRINEINAALASVKADELLPGAGGPVTEKNGAAPPPGQAEAVQEAVDPARETAEPVQTAAATAAEPAADVWVPRPPPPRAAIQRQLIKATASDAEPAPSAQQNPLAGAASPSPAADDTDSQAPAINLASLTTDLPANSRRGAEALLASLKAEKDARGLSMTVPGAQLFAVNSEEIDPSAFEALASVAKLVDLYEKRDVLIIGHTDAVGDAGYNQQLSERRAALVKEFFVERFEISPDRLEIEGQGEQNPINSNATADGRNANRRVEVVILE